jgi:predicted DsbA family dithiol-disulfide isomerase
MHDKIFEGQEVWSKGNAERLFIGYAEEIGLDTEVFTADMNSAEMNQIVMEQRKEGVRMGVNATPYILHQWDKSRKQSPDLHGI